jgi:integrase
MKSVYGRTKREATDALRKAQAEQEDGMLAVDDRLTVGKWLEYWTKTTLPIRVANGTLAESTFNNYKDTVRLHLMPGLGHIRLKELEPIHIDKFIAGQRLKGVSKPYSANSLRIMRSTLRKALNDALREGVVKRNVVLVSEPIRVERRASDWLDQRQARTLLDHIRGDRLEALYVVLLSLGLRRGEALGLRWEDIDFGNRTVRIARSLKRVQNSPLPDGTYPHGRTRLVFGTTKTSVSVRTVLLSEPCVKALQQHQTRQKKEQLACDGWQDNGLVFTTTIGTPLDPDNVGPLFSKLCEEAGLGHRNLHQLRHSAASIMLAEDVPLHTVGAVLGHSNLSTTKDVYGHLDIEQKVRAAEAISRALWDEAVGE